MKEILDRILTEEEEGGEIFRFNDLVFRLAGRTEGKIPHIHFNNRANTRFGAIRLDINSYFPHGGKYTDKLNKKENMLFNTFMTKKVFESIAETWNKQHPDGLKLNPKLKPNYSVIIMPNAAKGR